MNRRQYLIEKWANRTFAHYTIDYHPLGIEVIARSETDFLWLGFLFSETKDMRDNIRLNSEILYSEFPSMFKYWQIWWSVLTPSALQHIIEGHLESHYPQ